MVTGPSMEKYFLVFKLQNILSLKPGVSRSKRKVFFYVLQNTYFKISFLDKNFGDRLCFKDETKFLFSYF